jgi:hypothetical protein
MIVLPYSTAPPNGRCQTLVSNSEDLLRNLIVDALVGLEELEVDGALREAKIDVSTPAGWGREPETVRRMILLGLLDTEISTSRLMNLARGLRVRAAIEPVPDVSLARELKLSSGLAVDADGPIFVVHGHDHYLLHLAVRVLERATDRQVVVLREQPNTGRTVLEKFEQHASIASFAVVLLTGDDTGGSREVDVPRLRGRQNVIFELGFFFGKLGRNRVAVLTLPEVERPSDIGGLAYIVIDPAGAWKHELGRELAVAGIKVDYAAMP